MIVTAICKERINSVSLPEKVRGQYWLHYTLEGNEHPLVSIEGIDGKWLLKSNKNFHIINKDGKTLSQIQIAPGRIYAVQSDEGYRVFVFSEAVTDDRITFTKYIFKGDIKLTIGRDRSCDINYVSSVVSHKHATLEYCDGTWAIQDNNSSNGTFVNESRVDHKTLSYGDLIYIMGLKIVVGKNFLAINNPDNNVKLTGSLIPFQPQKITASNEEYEPNEVEYFYRSPRFKRDIETYKIKIDPPPASPIADEMPMALTLGSSLTMGMMSMVTLSSSIFSWNPIGIAMGLAMLLGTVCLPTIIKRYETKRKREKEEKRQRKYREYLESKSSEIDDECKRQKEILEENIVSVADCEERIIQRKRNLWERTFDHNDFLKVRVGIGDLAPDIDIDFGNKSFSLDDDNLQEELYLIGNSERKLKNVPISYSLKEDFISGVIGDRSQVIGFAKNIIFQLVSMFSYDEVKLIFLIDNNEYEELNFVKWLPHAWSDDKKFRYLATNETEVKEISAYISQEIENRVSGNINLDICYPYYIVISLAKSLAVKAEFIKNLLSVTQPINMSLICFYRSVNELPKECTMVTELETSNGKLYNKNDINGDVVVFTPDSGTRYNPTELSVSLANTQLDVIAQNYQLPSMLTFLNMFNVGKIEHLNIAERWKENDPSQSLRAPVGVDSFGGLLKLDLHEKFHGPHGLIAGTTGSGKSEFILTYILSLAINYHPEEVAFILIDYKGGGMAKSFEHLPHTVGIITNLDGSAIKRSLISIESELKRRQSIFSKTSKKVKTSNIDIYKYQKLYREGRVDEPLQHLFIISDEFAELKTQQPEFMKQLVSAARIGRSLGIHLILATQKPSGVVDDQIWSNSRFKVCLKVQDRADSQDMLKRPDAAELTDTGRFYLQIGYNESFELGQSAWSGAAYIESDSSQTQNDNTVSLINNNGLIVSQVKIDKTRSLAKNAPKQVDAITDYVCQIAQQDKIDIKPLWLPPIPGIVFVDDLMKQFDVKAEKYILNPIIGIYDDPAHQSQKPLTLPITNEGNAIIYGSAGSGKTTLLNSMIYSLITCHSPEELNLYIIDFGADTLGMFRSAPQVGDVAFSYEAEKIQNLFTYLGNELSIRKKMFADFGGSYISYIQNSNSYIPSIIVVINNFAAFSEMFENLDDSISVLTREGSKFGINFVVTSVGANGVKYRLLQNFNQSLALRLTDKADYYSIVGRIGDACLAKYKGRGFVKLEEIFEFQTTYICAETNQLSFIKDTCRILNEAYDTSAIKIKTLPDKIIVDNLVKFLPDKKCIDVPVGLLSKTVEPAIFNFEKSYINFILSESNEHKAVLDGFLDIFDHLELAVNVVELNGKTSKVFNHIAMCNQKDRINDFIDKLFLENVRRFKSVNNNTTEEFNKQITIISNFGSFLSSLDGERKEKLQLILSKGSVDLNMYFALSDSTSSYGSYSHSDWFRKQFNSKYGIWVGNGFGSQYVFQPSGDKMFYRQEIRENFGYIMQGSNALRVKFIEKN